MKVKIVEKNNIFYAKRRVLFFFWKRIRKYSWRWSWEVSFDALSEEHMKFKVLEMYPHAEVIKN